ncbi:PKD domain protein [Lutibacter sp. B1]|uniref:PKD domain protein n=1 Tax=Lutibacter sp. B1 TaxID=2725996 RepID=UPI00145632F7|nr:PKD domain protein [Lutibacter sp. B1]NLP57099.1 PKD domain protein [Lutibacter sp. B1]
MKTLKYFLSIFILISAVLSCNEDELGSTDFVDSVVAPTNVTVVFDITQDNTGLVTITPNSEGAVSYDIYFGDDTSDPVNVKQGKNITHIYAEGNYEVKVIAAGITGLKTEITQPLTVSFKAPENLVVTIENDAAISKQVNVTATADFATTFDVYFGEEGNDDPVAANIGETVSYIYAEPGIYTIKVVAKGGAIETTEYIVENFEVTAILQPLMKAPTPPTRNETDVVSIFSDKYTNITVNEWNPGWGQSTVLSSFDVDGDNILKYDYLNYTGIVTDYDNPTDLSTMEYIHFDYWTNDAESIGFKIVNTNQADGSPEKESEITISEITEGEWVSVEIPLTDFTTNMSEITQMLFVSNGVTVFIDNLYFYKAPSGVMKLMIEDFEGTAPTFTDFGNAGVQVISNPDISGKNTSATVAQFTKPSGADTWAGSYFEVATALELSTYSNISVKTWSPKVGAVVKLKLENSDASIVYEVDMNTTVANEWEELVYDFSEAPVADYVRVVIFFDFGNSGDDTVYYYDEVQLVSSGGEITPLTGTWKLAPEAYAFKVGPAPESGEWWASSADDVTARACLFDDTYVFGTDGSFTNVLGTDTWLEAWQGVAADGCGTPIAPHDGSNPATYSYDSNAGTVTLNGIGAYLVLSKANNEGELPNVPVPDSITYNVTFSDNDNTMTVVIEIGAGSGTFWTYKLVKA